MAAAVAGVFVVLQLCALAARQPCVGKESLGALFVRVFDALAVEPLRYKNWSLARATVQHRKRFVAELSEQWPRRNDWGLAVSKELRALREARGLWR